MPGPGLRQNIHVVMGRPPYLSGVHGSGIDRKESHLNTLLFLKRKAYCLRLFNRVNVLMEHGDEPSASIILEEISELVMAFDGNTGSVSIGDMEDMPSSDEADDLLDGE